MRDYPILALDVAKRLGWAYGAPGQKPTSGSVRLITPKQEEGIPEGELRRAVYRSLRRWLSDFLIVNRTRMVTYESPVASMIHGNTNVQTVRLLIGMAEHVEEVVPDGVELREGGISEIRKYFIGTGRPPKNQGKKMVMARCAALGWQYADDNAADALALWAYQCFCVDRSADVRGL
ncbi:hypothetical protein PQJ75_00875 [Rhodoplanes sp. TEM]|uniref:Uncharacterized protein n=1 Tax=Rhodoplanes tepidamans TaxID=200616 RepID=A0ABT5J5Y3_RHOTP|nr:MULTISPECIES: hypothetical protein [Rhodoplanes]MDC7784806.1 hypothetical protein [Rhodoplanes tepidamans]MDC7982273.1 hypothetical protein [Rhodoplanes sp. TEM]MDQ0356280.1 hypothetical protein [Rhodoplanes tepidamans]